MIKPDFADEIQNSAKVEVTTVTGEITCCLCGESEHVGHHFSTDNTKATLCSDCSEEMQDLANACNNIQFTD